MLRFTTNIGHGARTWKMQGLIEAEVELTTSTGTSGGDYSAGFDLEGNKAKFGFRTIFYVIGLSARVAAGTTSAALFVWDDVANKLRVFDASGGGEDNGTLVDAGGKVRFLVGGV